MSEGEHVLLVSEADLAIISSLDQVLGYIWVTESPSPGHVESFPMLHVNLGRPRSRGVEQKQRPVHRNREMFVRNVHLTRINSMKRKA
jgi:hypothetical protein